MEECGYHILMISSFLPPPIDDPNFSNTLPSKNPLKISYPEPLDKIHLRLENSSCVLAARWLAIIKLFTCCNLTVSSPLLYMYRFVTEFFFFFWSVFLSKNQLYSLFWKDNSQPLESSWWMTEHYAFICLSPSRM